MRFRKSNSGCGHNQFVYGFELAPRTFLIVAGDNEERIGEVETWEIFEIRDSVPLSYDEIKDLLHPLYSNLFKFMYEKELRDIEEARWNAEFFTEDCSGVRKLLKYVFKLGRYYETGGYLCVKCEFVKRDEIIAFIRREGFKAGISFSSIS